MLPSLAHSDVFCRIRQKSQVTRPLDRRSQGALVFGASATLASSLDAGTVGDETPEKRNVLVINVADVICTHNTNAAAASTAAARTLIVAGHRRSAAGSVIGAALASP